MTNSPSISRRTLLAVGGTLLAPGVLMAPGTLHAQGAKTLDKVKAAGVLVIGNGGAFPPFEFIADGQLTGFDRDLGDELCRRMGVKAEWVVSDFGGLIPGLTSGRVDIVLSALTRTEERARRIAFHALLYVRHRGGLPGDAHHRQSRRHHREDRRCPDRNSGGEVRPRQISGQGKGNQNYPEFPLALRDLEIGRTDLVVNNLPTLRYNIANEHRTDLKVSGAWDALDVGINTRLADLDLLTEINRHVADMKSDGFLKQNDAKWFGA